MSNTRQVGADGEDRACIYLEHEGYNVITRNFRIREAEIDIIAVKENTLVFIEVKKRKNNCFGEPCESVTRAKQRKILAAAEVFLVSEGDTYCGHEIRFDVIGLIGTDVTHIMGAFDDTR